MNLVRGSFGEPVFPTLGRLGLATNNKHPSRDVHVSLDAITILGHVALGMSEQELVTVLAQPTNHDTLEEHRLLNTLQATPTDFTVNALTVAIERFSARGLELRIFPGVGLDGSCGNPDLIGATGLLPTTGKQLQISCLGSLVKEAIRPGLWVLTGHVDQYRERALFLELEVQGLL